MCTILVAGGGGWSDWSLNMSRMPIISWHKVTWAAAKAINLIFITSFSKYRQIGDMVLFITKKKKRSASRVKFSFSAKISQWKRTPFYAGDGLQKVAVLVGEHHRDILQEELFPKPESCFLATSFIKKAIEIQASIRRVNATAILFYNVTNIIIVSPLFTFFPFASNTISAKKNIGLMADHWKHFDSG